MEHPGPSTSERLRLLIEEANASQEEEKNDPLQEVQERRARDKGAEGEEEAAEVVEVVAAAEVEVVEPMQRRRRGGVPAKFTNATSEDVKLYYDGEHGGIPEHTEISVIEAGDTLERISYTDDTYSFYSETGTIRLKQKMLKFGYQDEPHYSFTRGHGPILSKPFISKTFDISAYADNADYIRALGIKTPVRQSLYPKSVRYQSGRLQLTVDSNRITVRPDSGGIPDHHLWLRTDQVQVELERIWSSYREAQRTSEMYPDSQNLKDVVLAIKSLFDAEKVMSDNVVEIVDWRVEKVKAMRFYAVILTIRYNKGSREGSVILRPDNPDDLRNIVGALNGAVTHYASVQEDPLLKAKAQRVQRKGRSPEEMKVLAERELRRRTAELLQKA